MSEAFMRVGEREKVLAALERWALVAPANQIGPWSLVRPEQRQEMAETCWTARSALPSTRWV